jgi:hypothetical protein
LIGGIRDVLRSMIKMEGAFRPCPVSPIFYDAAVKTYTDQCEARLGQGCHQMTVGVRQ